MIEHTDTLMEQLDAYRGKRITPVGKRYCIHKAVEPWFY